MILRLAIVVLSVAFLAVLVRQLVSGGGGGPSAPRASAPEPPLPNEEGYSPSDPFLVTSVSVVEARAKRLSCRRCDGGVRVEDHAVERFEGDLIRVVSTRCKQHGHEDRLYFRIAPA